MYTMLSGAGRFPWSELSTPLTGHLLVRAELSGRPSTGEERVNLARADANESAMNHVGCVFVLSWLVLLEAFPLGASEECGLTS